MKMIFTMGIVFALYGVAGLLGFGAIPEKYRGKEWSKRYTRGQGAAFFILGVLWMALHLLTEGGTLGTLPGALLILACGVPALLLALWVDKKAKAKLEEEEARDE